jgi:hypothetical protein
METRRLQWSATLEPNSARPRVITESVPAVRSPQEALRQWVENLPIAPRRGKFIDKVKKLAAETRQAQRRANSNAKQAAINQIDARLTAIANELEAAIEKEAKEKGNGVLTYELHHPDNCAEGVAFPQLPNRRRAIIVEDDIRKSAAFIKLAAQCAKIGVQLDLVEQWSNISWNPYLGGNAAFVWRLTFTGW